MIEGKRLGEMTDAELAIHLQAIDEAYLRWIENGYREKTTDEIMSSLRKKDTGES